MTSFKQEISEKKMLFLLASIYFIWAIDIMGFGAFGPVICAGTGIAASDYGIVVAGATLAAVISGLLFFPFFDRFDRKKILIFSMIGLSLSQAISVFADSLYTLTFCRFLGGLFIGHVSGAILAIISDNVPEERRGAAMGKVILGQPLSVLIGVPLFLNLSLKFGHVFLFLSLSSLNMIMALIIYLNLPKQIKHFYFKTQQEVKNTKIKLLTTPVILILFCEFLTRVGFVAVIAQLTNYAFKNNLVAKEELPLILFLMGFATFLGILISGKWVDKFGAPKVVSLGFLLLSFALFTALIPEQPLIPLTYFAVVWGLMAATRNVPVTILASQAPDPSVRGRYMSVHVAINNVAATVGAAGTKLFLYERADQTLGGFNSMCLAVFIISVPIPFLVFKVHSLIEARKKIESETIDVKLDQAA